MENKFVLLITSSVLLISTLACSFYNPLKGDSETPPKSNDKSLSEKAVDSTVGEDRIGIPECDEVIDFFADQSKSNDDNFATKAFREYAMNKIRESFKKSVEENKGDPEKLAKECRDFKKQLDKYKAEEDRKQQPD